MKRVYLLLSIAGAVAPYWFFSKFLMVNGFDLNLFIQYLFANSPAAGFTIDLFISSACLWVMMFSEKNLKRFWPLIGVNLFIGLSCAFPLYLYFREKNEG